MFVLMGGKYSMDNNETRWSPIKCSSVKSRLEDLQAELEIEVNKLIDVHEYFNILRDQYRSQNPIPSRVRLMGELRVALEKDLEPGFVIQRQLDKEQLLEVPKLPSRMSDITPKMRTDREKINKINDNAVEFVEKAINKYHKDMNEWAFSKLVEEFGEWIINKFNEPVNLISYFAFSPEHDQFRIETIEEI